MQKCSLLNFPISDSFNSIKSWIDHNEWTPFQFRWLTWITNETGRSICCVFCGWESVPFALSLKWKPSSISIHSISSVSLLIFCFFLHSLFNLLNKTFFRSLFPPPHFLYNLLCQVSYCAIRTFSNFIRYFVVRLIFHTVKKMFIVLNNIDTVNKFSNKKVYFWRCSLSSAKQ